MKNQITVTKFFETRLGAPMVNDAWSWGAVRPMDNAIIFRVWQDEFSKTPSGSYRVQLQRFNRPEGDNGAAERARHVQSARAGAKAYGISCTRPLGTAGGKKSYDATRLFVLGTPYMAPDGLVYADVTGVQYL